MSVTLAKALCTVGVSVGLVTVTLAFLPWDLSTAFHAAACWVCCARRRGGEGRHRGGHGAELAGRGRGEARGVGVDRQVLQADAATAATARSPWRPAGGNVREVERGSAWAAWPPGQAPARARPRPAASRHRRPPRSGAQEEGATTRGARTDSRACIDVDHLGRRRPSSPDIPRRCASRRVRSVIASELALGAGECFVLVLSHLTAPWLGGGGTAGQVEGIGEADAAGRAGQLRRRWPAESEISWGAPALRSAWTANRTATCWASTPMMLANRARFEVEAMRVVSFT